jgi:hypothetical protein
MDTLYLILDTVISKMHDFVLGDLDSTPVNSDQFIHNWD